MRIVTVGTGCLVPSLTRGQSSVLVEEGATRAVIDMGLGTLTGLLRAGASHREIDLALITHLHPDHVAELASLLFAANYDPTPRTRPLTIIGGEGIERHMEALTALHGRWIEPKSYLLTIKTLTPGEATELGPLTIVAGAAAHTPASLAYRLEAGGRAASVTGDTGPSPEVEELAKGSDLLVAECSLPHDEILPGHLNAVQAGEMAEAAGVKTLLLTHFYPASEADAPAAHAATRFNGAIVEARDGLELTL